MSFAPITHSKDHFPPCPGGAIGGASAGLAILGEVVFDAHRGAAYPEQVACNPYHTRVSFTDDFLNILSGVLTDSHLHSGGRQEDRKPNSAMSCQGL